MLCCILQVQLEMKNEEVFEACTDAGLRLTSSAFPRLATASTNAFIYLFINIIILLFL